MPYYLLKCHRCAHIWIYNGKSDVSTICPECKTTVRIQKQKIPIDFAATSLVPTDGTKIVPGTAIPLIEKFGQKLSLALRLLSNDGAFSKTFNFAQPINNGYITPEELAESIGTTSGEYVLPDAVKEKLKKVMS